MNDSLGASFEPARLRRIGRNLKRMGLIELLRIIRRVSVLIVQFRSNNSMIRWGILSVYLCGAVAWDYRRKINSPQRYLNT